MRKIPFIAVLALLSSAGLVQAAIVELTSVDQLDFANVVKAYDFTGSTSIGTYGSSFDIGGVTFTRHNWNDSSHTFDGLTLSGQVWTGDNQSSGAPNVAAGGTATDQTNLNALLDWWNIGSGQDNSNLLLEVAVANGIYKVQYLVGIGSTTRGNEVFETDSDPDVSLGSFEDKSRNYLISDQVPVTDGTLNLRVYGLVSGSSDGRPIMSGLIVNQVPEPAIAALMALGALALLRRRARR